MSADKYPSIFSRQMKAIVYILRIGISKLTKYKKRKTVNINNYVASIRNIMHPAS